MKILLDTHVFLWAITEDARLTKKQQDQFLDIESDLYFSTASVWETLIKVGLGKLPLPTPAAHYLNRQMAKNRVVLLPIRMAHLVELENLPPLHRDPFDRLLIAQARSEKMLLMTDDEKISKYPVDLL